MKASIAGAPHEDEALTMNVYVGSGASMTNTCDVILKKTQAPAVEAPPRA